MKSKKIGLLPFLPSEMFTIPPFPPKKTPQNPLPPHPPPPWGMHNECLLKNTTSMKPALAPSWAYIAFWNE